MTTVDDYWVDDYVILSCTSEGQGGLWMSFCHMFLPISWLQTLTVQCLTAAVCILPCMLGKNKICSKVDKMYAKRMTLEVKPCIKKNLFHRYYY